MTKVFMDVEDLTAVAEKRGEQEPLKYAWLTLLNMIMFIAVIGSMIMGVVGYNGGGEGDYSWYYGGASFVLAVLTMLGIYINAQPGRKAEKEIYEKYKDKPYCYAESMVLTLEDVEAIARQRKFNKPIKEKRDAFIKHWEATGEIPPRWECRVDGRE